MTLPSDVFNREYKKFQDLGNSEVGIKVATYGAAPVYSNRAESAVVTFVAGTTGSVAAHPIATVTGTVAMTCFAKIVTDATSGGSATISVGTALSPVGLIALTTYDKLDANELWHDATPDASIELTSVITAKVVNQSVIYNIADATITGGSLQFFISWTPISSDGAVTLVI